MKRLNLFLLVTVICSLLIVCKNPFFSPKKVHGGNPATEPVTAIELQELVDDAEDIKDEVSISEDGSDVDKDGWWVTQEEWDALEDAIRDAEEAIKDGRDLDDIYDALENAIDNFNKAKKRGIKAVTAIELQELIDDAEDAKDEVSISEDGSDVSEDDWWVTQEEWDVLEDAIKDAEEAIKDGGNLDDIYDALEKAIDNFNKAKKRGTKVAPTAANISVANNNKTYNGNPQSATVVYNGITEAAAGIISVTYSTAEPTNAGSYDIFVTTAGGTEYAAITTPLNVGTLTIAKANPVVSWPTGLTAAALGQTISNIQLPGNGTSTPAGNFTWTTSGTLVGSVGTQTHNMTFTPGDTTNYNTLTQNVTVTVNASLIEMVQLPAGTFIMGSPDGTGGTTLEPNRQSSETQHPVTLTSGYYMGKYLVTQKQYQAVMTSWPSNEPSSTYGVGDNFPMYFVNWYDAIEFCNRLSVLEGLTPAYSLSGSTNTTTWGTKGSGWNAVTIVAGSTGYRLPTEAQWEYACRGNYANKTTEMNTKPFAIDNGTKMTHDLANFYGHSPYDALAIGGYYDSTGIYLSKTTEVGSYTANNYGLHDMHGNLWEWCWDWYNADYTNSFQTRSGGTGVNEDPAGAVTGSDRVLRGGSWNSYGQYLRSANRSSNMPSDRHNNPGFRLVRP